AWQILVDLPGETTAVRIASGLHELETGKLNPAIALEVVETAEKRKGDPAVSVALKNYGNSLPKDDPLAGFQICLQGGDPVNGEAVFRSNPTGQCLRCHRVDSGHSEGGEAGPNLAGIGKRHDAKYFLESLILPNAVVAPGFGVVSLTFKNGTSKSGILSSENADTIELLEGMDLWRIQKSDIRERSKPVSAMAPPMGAVLTRREIRDLVAWLGSLTRNDPPAPPSRSATDLDPDTLPVNPSGNGAGTPQPAVVESPPPNGSGNANKTSGSVPKTGPKPETTPDRETDGEPRTTIGNTINSRQMKLGQETYLTCLACHGDRGQGVPVHGGPPLAPSEWVVGPAENLIRIQIRGLRDNITVNHQHYTLGVDINPAGMIPLPQTNDQIAAVLTYIRNSWGNRASAVTPGMVEEHRAEIGQPPLKVTDLISPPLLPKTVTKTSGSAARTSGPVTGKDGIRHILIILGILIWCTLCTIPLIRRFKKSNRAGRE
ncbi:MAG: c-type cytochrome, partial [Verrucomicrobiota bacterium]|nr:c-type cytochrome [Verrucomicrobiota bacterium]